MEEITGHHLESDDGEEGDVDAHAAVGDGQQGGVAGEEAVDGVFRCRIVEHNITTGAYHEVTDNNYNISCSDSEYYRVDITDIEDRITEASFSIDLSIVNS